MFCMCYPTCVCFVTSQRWLCACTCHSSFVSVCVVCLCLCCCLGVSFCLCLLSFVFLFVFVVFCLVSFSLGLVFCVFAPAHCRCRCRCYCACGCDLLLLCKYNDSDGERYVEVNLVVHEEVDAVVDINGGNDVASVSNLTRLVCNDVWRTQHGSVGRFLHCGKPWFKRFSACGLRPALLLSYRCRAVLQRVTRHENHDG